MMSSAPRLSSKLNCIWSAAFSVPEKLLLYINAKYFDQAWVLKSGMLTQEAQHRICTPSHWMSAQTRSQQYYPRLMGIFSRYPRWPFLHKCFLPFRTNQCHSRNHHSRLPRGEKHQYLNMVTTLARQTLIGCDGSQLANFDSDLYIKSVYLRESNFIVWEVWDQRRWSPGERKTGWTTGFCTLSLRRRAVIYWC